MTSSILADARQGARWLARHPWLAFTVVATLAVAFSTALAGFTVIDAVLLRPLPFPDASRIVNVRVTSPAVPAGVTSSSLQDVGDWRMRSRSFDAITAYTPQAFRLTGRGEPREVDAQRVERDFDRVLGLRPIAGRLFMEADFITGGSRVAVLANGFWRREFGADPSVVGTTIDLDEQPYRIVGVLPPVGITYPDAHDLWVPLVPRPGAFWEASRGSGWVMAVARLAPAVPPDAAAAELSAVAVALAREYPGSNKDRTVAQLTPIRDELVGPMGKPLALLAAALAAVLIIAFGNIANLLLASGAHRRGEFAVRAALGAGRIRLARQLVAEATILSVTAAGIAVAVEPVLVRAFLAVNPAPLPRTPAAVTSPVTVGVAAILALVAGAAIAAPQILRTARVRIVGPDVGRTTESRGERATAYLLVSVQVALSLLLVVAGVALVRTVAALMATDQGIRLGGVLTFMAKPSPHRFPTGADAAGFHDSVLETLREINGVQVAATGLVTPMTSSGWRFGIRPRGSDKDVLVAVNIVSPDYFAALGISVVEGRQLTAAEQRTATSLAMVNTALARALAPDGAPVVGRRLNYSGTSWEIVGRVSDVRHGGPRRSPMPELFIPWHMAGKADQAFIVRAAGDPMALVPEIAARVRAVDPSAPLTNVATLDDRLRRAVAAERFRATLLGTMTLIAVVLAALGAYSVTAYSVARRTREYGIRLALGELPSSIRRRALRTAVSPAAAGVVAGALASLWAAGFLEAFVYEVSARDARVLSLAALSLLGIAALAATSSAERAARVDPARTLRPD